MRKPRGGRCQFFAIAASFATLLWLLATPVGALAISAPIHISGTGGEGVFIRPEPNTSRSAIGWMPEGASPDYNCFAWGQNINGVPIWFNVNYGGVTGYYASFYDDSSYHSNDELTAKYGVPLCGSAPAPPAPSPSPAPVSGGGGLVFSVFNADGGIYYRNGPHWNETSAIPGVGVYNGDRVELICGAFGDAVGPYRDTAWSKVRNLTRPSIGEGWVNEHYINDGAPSNAFSAGEPMCGSTGSTTAYPTGGSLYYSPYKSSDPGHGRDIIQHWGPFGQFERWISAPAPSTFTANYDEWHPGSGNACPDASSTVPPRIKGGAIGGKLVTTLAAWSIARSAPLLFLQVSPWATQISYLLLLDPGDLDEYRSSNCSKSMYQRLALWLGESKSHRLAVLAGKVTADYENPVNGHGHAGIQNYLFPAIRNYPNVRGQNIRQQVVVCNYDDMSHEDVWLRFRGAMNAAPITLSSCPEWVRGEDPVAWNP